MNVVAVAVFLAASSAYLQTRLKDALVTETTRNLETQARLVRSAIEQRDPDATQRAVREAAADSGARVTVIERGGRVVADSEAFAGDMDDHGTRPEVVRAIEKGTGTSLRHSDTRNAEFLYVAITDHTDNEAPVIRVAMPAHQLSASLEVVQNTIFFAVGVMFLAGLLLSFLLAQAIVRPIEVVRSAAQQIAEGNLGARVEMARKDEFGELVGAFNSMSGELTNRVRQLEAGRRELSAIMDNMSEGLLLVDANGVVKLCNRAAGKLLDTDADKLAGQGLWESVRLPEVDELLSSLKNLTEPRRIWVEDRTRGSQRRVLAFVATPLFQTVGGEEQAVLLISDATEDQKLLEMRQDFVANVSHELKTPLTSISAYVETLLDGAANDENVRIPFLSKIQTNTVRLSKLVSDILNLSRLESGTGDESRAHLDLAELCRTCVNKHRETAEKQGISLTLHAPDESVIALVNEEDLTEAIDNLVVNAVSYTPEGGSVDVTVSREGQGLVVEVKDTGCGIPEDALPRVFERFYRVDKARSRDLGGTGLGLAIVKHVALKHGGKVEAKSEVGKGSLFRVTLPSPSPVK